MTRGCVFLVQQSVMMVATAILIVPGTCLIENTEVSYVFDLTYSLLDFWRCTTQNQQNRVL